MTGNEQSQLRFDISENVTFHRDQPGIGTLLSLDLTPEVRIEDLGANVRIEGVIRLSGTYLSQSDGTPEQQAERLAHVSEDEEVAGEDIHYVIPVEITLPSERAGRLADITAEIQSFDYEIVSSHQLAIEALLVVDGLQLGNLDHKTNASFGEQENNQALVKGYDDTPFTSEQELLGEEWYNQVSYDDTPSTSEPQEIHLRDFKPEQDHEAENDAHQGQGEARQESHDEQDLSDSEFVNRTPNDERSIEQPLRSPGKQETDEQMESIKMDDIEKGTEETTEPVSSEQTGDLKQSPEENLSAEGTFTPEEEGESEKHVQHETESHAQPHVHFQRKVEKKIPDSVSLNDLLKKEDDQEGISEPYIADAEDPAPQNIDESSPVDYAHDEPMAAEDGLEQHESDETQMAETGTPTGIEWMKQKLGGDEDRFHRLRMVIVQNEDTLESIADRYDLSSVELLQLNKLESGDLERGQIVYLPDRES